MNYLENQMQKSERFELELKARVYEIARLVGTRKGFFEYYFKIVLRCGSQREAFEVTNTIHYLIFDEYMFTGYESFRKSKNRFLKN